MLLALPEPIDLAATLNGGQTFRWRLDDDGWWTGFVDGDLVRLRTPDAAVGRVLEVESSGAPSQDFTPRVLHYLGLDVDMGPVRAALSADPVLAEAMALFPGLRLLRQPPWECLAGFILSAHCHVPRIQRNMEAVARAAGVSVAAWDRTVHAFPSPTAVVGLGEAALRALGLGFRAPNLLRTAAVLAAGGVDLESLRTRPFDEARRELISRFPGVGPKIADCVLAFSLDHAQAFPVDRWVLRALERSYLDGAAMTPEKAAGWARERFGQHAAYAQQLLFHRERTRGLAALPLPGSRSHRALAGAGVAYSAASAASHCRASARSSSAVAASPSSRAKRSRLR